MISRLWQATILVSILTIAKTNPRFSREINSENAVGYSTKAITTALLKDHEEETNLVFSPFGYSTIFALLEEGAKGETEKELQNVLKLSKESTRSTFKEILTSLKEKYTLNLPQLKTWFYVYKNFSVEEEYKTVLKNNYLTQVKNVYPHQYEIIQFDKTKSDEVKPVEDTPTMTVDEGNSPYKEKEAIEAAEKEYYLTKEAAKIATEDNEEVLPKKSSIIENPAKTEIEEKDKVQEVNTENGQEGEQLTKFVTENVEKVLNNDIVDIKKKLNSAEESLKTGFNIRNILPGGKTKEGKSDDDVHSMIIFNGLYFEGIWAVPFDDEITLKDFHVNKNLTIQIETLKSKGVFKMADIPRLNSTALLLPFQGGRYTFLIVLPWECDGVNELVRMIDVTTLEEIYGMLQDTEAEIELPVISLESTTKPESAICKIGVKSLFKKGADLTGIARESNLYTEEIVQLVTLQLNNGTSSTNFMTASSVKSRDLKKKFQAKHPFLFFIEDNTYNVTMVAGKFYKPYFDFL